jgi:hypothetical protein
MSIQLSFYQKRAGREYRLRFFYETARAGRGKGQGFETGKPPLSLQAVGRTGKPIDNSNVPEDHAEVSKSCSISRVIA